MVIQALYKNTQRGDQDSVVYFIFVQTFIIK
jgi:hypothetical protein